MIKSHIIENEFLRIKTINFGAPKFIVLILKNSFSIIWDLIINDQIEICFLKLSLLPL